MTDSDSPQWTAGDEAIIKAAATGEGLILVTADELLALVQAAGETAAFFKDAFADMTREQAEFVRRLRVDEGYSWRAVAATYDLEYGTDTDGNQLAGIELCAKAAEFFGEHYMDEGTWN